MFCFSFFVSLIYDLIEMKLRRAREYNQQVSHEDVVFSPVLCKNCVAYCTLVFYFALFLVPVFCFCSESNVWVVGFISSLKAASTSLRFSLYSL